MGDAGGSGDARERPPTSRADGPLVQRIATPGTPRRLAGLGSLTKASWPRFLRGLSRAVDLSISTPARVVRFALGIGVGYFVSLIACALVTAVYPLTASLAFALTTFVTGATAVFFALGFPLKDVITSEERNQLDRAKAVFDMRTAGLDQLESQLRSLGMTDTEIQVKLVDGRQKAMAEFQGVIDRIAGANSNVRSALSEGSSKDASQGD